MSSTACRSRFTHTCSMTLEDLPTPALVPLDWVSPTTANSLWECGYRVALSRDPALREWQRPTPFTAMGNAAHVLSERVTRGEFNGESGKGLEAALDSAWWEEIQRQADRLNASWGVPQRPPAEWPGYELARLRTVRRLARDVRQRRDRSMRDDVSVQTEVDMVDEEHHLIGRADRVEHAGDRTRVVDLKTGLAQGEPTQQQRRQLLLYAWLVKATTGRWPSAVVLEIATGHQFAEPVVRAEVESLLAALNGLIAGYNAAMASGHQAVEALAAADAQTCRRCPFRIVCRPFWSNLTTSWDPPQRAMLGTIEASGQAANGFHASVLADSPIDQRETTWHVAGLPSSPAGKRFAVIDARGGPADRELQSRQSSVWRSW